MPKRTYILFPLLIPFLVSAQVVSNGGRFSADFARGCAPFELHVTSLDTFGNITRQYFYEQGATETTDTFYTYNTPGVYEIVQVVGIDVNPKTDTLVVRVLEPTDLHYSVKKCNLNGVSVTSEEEVYDFIRVYFTPTDSSTLLQGETASFNYNSTAAQTFTTKGFYASAKENCAADSYLVSPLSSLSTPTIISSSIKETCLDYFVMVLELEGYDSLVNYQVVLSQTSSTPVFEGRITDNQLVVPNVPYAKAASEYCVRVDALDNCTQNINQGSDFCVSISEKSSTPFSNLYSSYSGNEIFLNLDSVLVGSFQVYRKLGESGEFELRSTVQNAYSDPIGSPARAYFYRIEYLDTCSQVLFTGETNPPLLTSSRKEENTYSITVTHPVSTLSPATALSYELGNESTTTEPIPADQFDISLNPENGTRQFLQVTSTHPQGIELRSNQITYKYKSVIHVPNAFTPNGDGLNDTLELFGLPSPNASTRIYTRWGKLIYSSSEPSPGWNGFIGRNLAPEGVYLYEVIFEDSDGVKISQKGTFAIIKK